MANSKHIITYTQLYRKNVKNAQLLLESAQNSPNTDTLEVALSLLSSHLFTLLECLPKLTLEELTTWSKVLSQLTNSQVKISKTRLAFQHTVQTAKNAILHELRLALKEHPHLLQEMTRIVHNTHVSVS